MNRHNHDGVVFYRFRILEEFPEVVHGAFTRLGGVSAPPFATLNLGHTVGDAPESVDENHRRVCQVLDVAPSDLVSPHQVHGARVVRVTHAERGQVIPATDALITDQPGVTLLLRFADCLPILLYDPAHQAVGLAHAGWRGTVAGVARATVAAMREAFGSHPEDLVVGLGPAIGPCCYEVGPEVVRAVQAVLPKADGVFIPQPGGGVHLNLPEANWRQLVAAGVRHIEVAPLCTACNTGEWFSHRAEGGRTGRFGVAVVLKC